MAGTFDKNTGGEFIPILITGTDHESPGTPVTLTINPELSTSGDKAALAIIMLNGNDYSKGNLSVIGGFTVGDTFQFASLITGMTPAPSQLTVELSVAAAVGAAPVPEPATGLLSGAGLIAGYAEVFNALTQTSVRFAPNNFSSNALSVQAPLSLFGGNEFVNYVVVGTFDEPTVKR